MIPPYGLYALVPRLCLGIYAFQGSALKIALFTMRGEAEPPGQHSQAEPGNENYLKTLSPGGRGQGEGDLSKRSQPSNLRLSTIALFNHRTVEQVLEQEPCVAPRRWSLIH